MEMKKAVMLEKKAVKVENPRDDYMNTTPAPSISLRSVESKKTSMQKASSKSKSRKLTIDPRQEKDDASKSHDDDLGYQNTSLGAKESTSGRVAQRCYIRDSHFKGCCYMTFILFVLIGGVIAIGLGILIRRLQTINDQLNTFESGMTAVETCQSERH